MSDSRVRLVAPLPMSLRNAPCRPIGRYLVDNGIVPARRLFETLSLQRNWDAPLGEILVAEGLASEADVLDAVAQQHGLNRVDLEVEPPDPLLFDLLPAQDWVHHRVVPWKRLGGSLVVATPRPDRIDDLKSSFPDEIDTVKSVVASEAQVFNAVETRCARQLAHRAEHRVDADYSCRTWRSQPRRTLHFLPLAGAAAAAIALLWPLQAALALCALAYLTLLPVAGLKFAAFTLQLFGRLHDPPGQPAETTTDFVLLPRISVMVPLFHETEIAGALVRRLKQLDYPKALLDVILVLEENDTITRSALETADLPHWMRPIVVPESSRLTTKPRALNYALDFCRGDIIGVWDAEDAPAADQLHRVAAQFATAPPDVVCLQGALDFYNPRSSWLTRCFTIEYAGWWRILLPGVARMGMVLPLGGTTLFFRRHALNELGCWDAHNVTEDADLGIRLARAGYRTQIIPTTTYEEATCRLRPWIKQRSRWLKGFMVTWLVHMRRPGLLLRQMGWWRCLGVHALMAGTVAQFALAPVHWLFWLIALGYEHPAAHWVTPGWIIAIVTLYFVVEIGNLVIGAAGVTTSNRWFLLPWVLTMPFYHVFGAAAAVKAMYELIVDPYYWDKTQHGQAQPDSNAATAGLRRRPEAGS